MVVGSPTRTLSKPLSRVSREEVQLVEGVIFVDIEGTLNGQMMVSGNGRSCF